MGPRSGEPRTCAGPLAAQRDPEPLTELAHRRPAAVPAELPVQALHDAHHGVEAHLGGALQDGARDAARLLRLAVLRIRAGQGGAQPEPVALLLLAQPVE